jgi:ribonuclease-3
MAHVSNQERVAALQKKLGVPLLNEEATVAALTHKSYTNEHKEPGLQNNERLEFLGDAVVDLAIGHRLMERFPGANEGELSKLRALIVNEEGLSKVARGIALGELLLLGRGEELTGGREKSSVLADALEAVLGAVYWASGLDTALELVDRLFEEALNGVASGNSGQDYKTILQEDAQLRLKAAPRYRVLSEAGPDHEKTFEVEVAIGAEVLGVGKGRSKKEAEQAAAKNALNRLSDVQALKAAE